MSLVQEIKNTIERCLDEGKRIAIYPLGDLGLQTKLILKEIYGLEPVYIFDNHICKYNKTVRPFSEAADLDMDNVTIILALAQNNQNLRLLRQQIINSNYKHYEIMYPINNKNNVNRIGKYSYGDLTTKLQLIESIGSFCSFAEGTRVVPNHPTQYISTHPFIYADKHTQGIEKEYSEYRGVPWFVEGIKPKGIVNKRTKSRIGNDVWLGRNVTITNGANVGNGVIAGAGSVITRDVPDYAVVVGVPAKIIRYRYNSDQIEALNRICWWDWTDDEIRERYDDFFLPIDDFIAKYDI